MILIVYVRVEKVHTEVLDARRTLRGLDVVKSVNQRRSLLSPLAV